MSVRATVENSSFSREIMKPRLIIFFTLILSNFSFAQIDKRDLYGDWKTSNKDNLYYNADSITFTKTGVSYPRVIWNCIKEKFESHSEDISSSPHIIGYRFDKQEKLELIDTDYGQIIEHYVGDKVVEKYKVVEFENGNEAQLTLMRFDKLPDNKLYKYVDSLAKKVARDNLNEHLDESNSSSVDTTLSNLSKKEITEVEPLIIINGYIAKDKEPLKELLLVETSYISFLTRRQTAAIYGKPLNGIIVIRTSEKRFKQVWKKFEKETKK